MQYAKSRVVIQGASRSVHDYGSTEYGEPTLSRAWTGTRVCIRTLRWRVVLLVLVSFGFWKGLVEPMESPGPYHQGPPVLRRTISELKARPRVGDEVRELVIVPGRAVYVGSNFILAKDDSNWVMDSDSGVLEGQAKTLTEHMETGMKEVANNPNAMLLFSGGKTCRSAGALSQASSYWHVCKALDWFGVDAEVRARVFTEEYARDSFENLFFSVNRFYELTQRFPEKITIVGSRERRQRFEKLHLEAIAYPEANFTYVETVALDEKKIETEEANMLAAFQRDPYGCRGKLAENRLARDPFNDGIPYSTNVKVLSGLWVHVNTCPPHIFNGLLPWSKGVLIV